MVVREGMDNLPASTFCWFIMIVVGAPPGKGYFPAGSKVLYAHLGGVPAINAYSYIYRNG